MYTNHRFSCTIFYKSSKSLDFMTNRPKYDPANILGHSEDTGDMRGHVFGHQAPLPRPLEVARAACSISKRRRRRPPWLAKMSRNHGFSWIFKNFQEFSKNHDFRRKIKVAKSVRIRFWAIQGMRTRLETISRHPECVLLAPHAASRVG